MLRISDIKLGTDDTESDLRKKVLKLLGVKNVKSFEISKKINRRTKKSLIYIMYIRSMLKPITKNIMRRK